MKYQKTIISSLLALSSFSLICQVATAPNPDYLITVEGNKEILSSDDLINSFVSSNTFSRTQMIEIIHSVLVERYGNKYSDKAQKRYQQNMGNKSNAEFEQSLQLQGMTPQSYLDSIENFMIIQNEIYKTYKPSQKQLKNAYQRLHNEYWIEGIYLTKNTSSVSDQEINKIKSSIEKGNTSFKELNGKKDYHGFSVSGIGLNGSTVINQISSDNYISIKSDMKKKIDKIKVGEYITGYDSSYGHYIVKKVKVKKPGSFKDEKELLSKQIRYEKSNDVDEQTKFIQKLFNEEKVKGNTKQIREIIKVIKEGDQ